MASRPRPWPPSSNGRSPIPASRVVADTHPELSRSIRVLQKNGFRYSGPGKGERLIRYELTRAAWIAVVR
jgi:RimJ/RimL family protein N-acetyltransferase